MKLFWILIRISSVRLKFNFENNLGGEDTVSIIPCVTVFILL